MSELRDGGQLAIVDVGAPSAVVIRAAAQETFGRGGPAQSGGEEDPR
jgi:hypothetical protein